MVEAHLDNATAFMQSLKMVFAYTPRLQRCYATSAVSYRPVPIYTVLSIIEFVNLIVSPTTKYFDVFN